MRQVSPASLATTLRRPVPLVLLSLAAALRAWSVCAQLPERANRWDFSIYYASAMLWRQGHNPYTTDFAAPGLDTGDIHRATHTPTFLLCIQPLARLPERVAFYTWIGLNAVFLTLSLALLLPQSARQPTALVAILALVLLYPPVASHFLAGQGNILVLLLLVLMMRALEAQWDAAAGLCLAWAGLLRMFPFLLLGYLAAQRRWRALTWSLAATAMGATLTVALFGVRNSLSFRFGVAIATRQRWLMGPSNIALAAAVSRMLWFLGAGDLVRWLLVGGADAALLVATAGATLALPPAQDPDWCAFGMWVVASVLLSPTAWLYNMVLFFIPFAALLSAASGGRATLRAQWTAILSYAVVLCSTTALDMTQTVYAWLGATVMVGFVLAVGQGLLGSALLIYMASYWSVTERGSNDLHRQVSD